MNLRTDWFINLTTAHPHTDRFTRVAAPFYNFIRREGFSSSPAYYPFASPNIPYLRLLGGVNRTQAAILQQGESLDISKLDSRAVNQLTTYVTNETIRVDALVDRDDRKFLPNRGIVLDMGKGMTYDSERGPIANDLTNVAVKSNMRAALISKADTGTAWLMKNSQDGLSAMGNAHMYIPRIEYDDTGRSHLSVVTSKPDVFLSAKHECTSAPDNSQRYKKIRDSICPHKYERNWLIYRADRRWLPHRLQ